MALAAESRVFAVGDQPGALRPLSCLPWPAGSSRVLSVPRRGKGEGGTIGARRKTVAGRGVGRVGVPQQERIIL